MTLVLVLSMLLMLMIVLLFILALGILSSPVGSGGDSRRVLRYNSDYTEYFVHGGNEIVCNVDEFLREKNFKQSIPAVKVDDGLEINHQMATTALRRAVHLLSDLQFSDGHWPAENAGSLFFLPPLAEGGDAEEEESDKSKSEVNASSAHG